MTISSDVRKQLLASFRVELQEHVQTITDGLLQLEQETQSDADASRIAEAVGGELLEGLFRAAHSLKGAARAVEITPVVQLAHALEDALDLVRHHAVELVPDFFTACYQTLDAIQIVQGGFESGRPIPDIAPVLATLAQATNNRVNSQSGPATTAPSPQPAVAASKPAPREQAAGVRHTSAPSQSASEQASAEVDNRTRGDAAVLPRQADEPGPPVPADDGETIRVQVSKLDALMEQLSELLLTKIRVEQRLTQLRQIEDRLATWQADWQDLQLVANQLARQRQQSASGNLQVDQILERLLVNRSQLRDVTGNVSVLAHEYTNDALQMSLVVDKLEEEIKRVRMLPLSTILRPFGRMVRDLAQEAGKQVVLQVRGADTELDKRVLEQIKDPLIHLLRNAVDHGIELPDARRAAGKEPHGTITLSAEQLGQDVLIRIADDGQGLDLKALQRVVAHRTGADPDALTQWELEQAIYSVGVSTSPVITDISGRGVGLDVVRRNVEELHGRIELSWSEGQGTEFLLTLPLALSSTRGLLVSAGGLRFAIPLSAIVRIMPLDTSKVTEIGGNPCLNYQDEPIPLARLADVLELASVNARPAGQSGAVVMLASAERRMAFIVDDLEGEQEIVNKGLGRQLRRVGGIAGATVLGTGEIVLVLNVGDLIKMALRSDRQSIMVDESAGPQPVAARVQHRLLIVDDSITTRTLEKNILEAAGYIVDIATNGQEAWDMIASRDLPDLVVSDVSMPRMDGIELTTRIKREARTSLLPVILVTSLDSPQDKARGIEAGADAYITKGSFDQNGLLNTVRQLI